MKLPDLKTSDGLSDSILDLVISKQSHGHLWNIEFNLDLSEESLLSLQDPIELLKVLLLWQQFLSHRLLLLPHRHAFSPELGNGPEEISLILEHLIQSIENIVIDKIIDELIL